MGNSLLVDTIFPELSTALLIIPNSCDGIFSRFTMTSMTGAWYTGLNPVETLLVGVIVLQVLAFRYYQILPLDVTKLIQDHELVFGKRKRRRRSIIKSHKGNNGGLDYLFEESLFAAVRKIDKYDCLLRTICELEYLHSIGGIQLSEKNRLMIQNFKRSGMERERKNSTSYSSHFKVNYPTIPDRPIISIFEEAVLIGHHFMEMVKSKNEVTINTEFSCSYKYNLCPLTKAEIVRYVNIV